MKPTPPVTSRTSPLAGEISSLVRLEQWAAIRRGMLSAIPVNIVLSVLVAWVAWKSGHGTLGAWWLAASLLVNGMRVGLCLRTGPTVQPVALAGGQAAAPLAEQGRTTQRRLRVATATAFVAGGIWALIPLLCEGYTSRETVFYLMVVCGLCAGSVTYGIAYAPVPIAFFTPALLSAIGALVYARGFEHLILAGAVLLYLATLLRSVLQGQEGFIEASRLKNEATTTMVQLQKAHRVSTAATQQLALRLSHDRLTGLFNREGIAEAAMLQMSTTPGGTWAVLLVNLDGFKAINDALGHVAGDRVLQDVARWLERELLAQGAVLGRWGGDEYAVFLATADGEGTARTTAERLLAGIDAASPQAGSHLGASIGIAVSHEAPFADLVSFADEAMQAAKRSGRNRLRVFDAALGLRLAVRKDIEAELEDAMASRAVTVWYQPIVHSEDGRLHSLEALMRWHHPRHGYIAPEEVIAAAARTGLAEALLRLLVRLALDAVRTLDEAGPPFHGIPIAINVSPREMSQVAVDRLVLDLLRAHGVSAHRLQIEITEELALDTQAARDRLQTLAAAGVAIVVDDFGVGYSSLSSLRGDYVRQVKVDRSFIAGLPGTAGRLALVESIVRLGRTLDIEVVAEGVETAEELAALRELGCPLVQGFHLARPAPLQQLLAGAGQGRQRSPDAA
ncbi:putative bifunctional diguanylate cyclase/phosphodiesterase [Variovorax sp. ZT4R33]|uniref:putative bifunctional diguanylate cyclase/phosphodiesterase n=1 Tax=Variovorax sp. ZT4R33 TaxID=3443743 RepID=UPI003F448A3D